MYINPLSNFSLTLWANTSAKRWKTKKKKADKEVRVLFWCVSCNFHRAHPAPVEHSTSMDQKVLLKKRACKASPPSLCLTAVTYLFLVRAMEQLSPGPAAPQSDCERSQPWAWSSDRKVMHLERRLKTRHIHVFRAGFPCCSSCSASPNAGCDHPRRSEVMLQACSNFSAFLTQGWISLLWVSSAGAQLCFSAVPGLSLTSLPTTCLKQCSEQERKRNQSSQNYLPRASYLHLQHTSNSWHHWPFKQIRSITARSNVK